MSVRLIRVLSLCALALPTLAGVAAAQPNPARPWVYEAPKSGDEGERARRPRATEIGTLLMMTAQTRNAVLSRVSGDRVYDLAVQYFIGLPSWYSDAELPPIVARAVLIDVASQRNVPVLPDDYRITTQDLQDTLGAQRLTLRQGDIVIIRGGKITLDAAKWLAEEQGAMIIGGDALSLETYKYGRPDLTVPVHNYLLNQRGIAILQVERLEELVRDKVYEFAFIAASLRSGKSDAVQFRPLAFPLR